MLDNYKKIPVKTTYMEMTEKPNFEFEEREWVSVTHFDKPNIDLYKDVYKRVGEKWGWTGRLILSDEELKEKIHHENTEFYCLFEKENLVGFFELDKNLPSEVEIIYLGVVPEYIGKGFGGLLLKLAIHHAWEFEPQRVCLHTCEFDHKNALAVYQKYGFKAYKTSVDNEYYSLDFLEKHSK